MATRGPRAAASSKFHGRYFSRLWSAHRSHGDMASAAAEATGLWGHYLRFCAAYPLSSAIGTSAVLWGLGDATAQLLEPKSSANGVDQHDAAPNNAGGGHGHGGGGKQPTEGFDFRRWLATVFQGSLVAGGGGLYWYAFLDRVVSKHAVHGTAKFVGMKLALEFAVWHPFTLLSFWTVVGLLQGSSVSQIRRELSSDYGSALASEYVLWTPIDILNFWLVPVHLQVLCINCGCLLEAIVVSYIHSHGFPQLFASDTSSAAGAKGSKAAPSAARQQQDEEPLPPPSGDMASDMRRRVNRALTIESRDHSLPLTGNQRELLPARLREAITQRIRRPAALRLASREWDRLDATKTGQISITKLLSLANDNLLPGVSDKLVSKFLGHALEQRAVSRTIPGTGGNTAVSNASLTTKKRPADASSNLLYVTKEEYMALLNCLHQTHFEYQMFDQAIFALFDKNRDGSIDRREAAEFCRVVHSYAAKSKQPLIPDDDCVAQLFEKYDTNKDNALSFAELRHVMRDLRTLELSSSPPPPSSAKK